MLHRHTTQSAGDNSSQHSLDSLRRNIAIQKVYDESAFNASLNAVKVTKPKTFLNTNFMDQFNKKGFYRTVHPDVQRVQEAVRHSMKLLKKKLTLEVALSILDLLKIDPIEGSFKIKFVQYVVFELDMHELGFSEIADAAQEHGYYHTLTPEEVSALQEKFTLPNIIVFNMLAIADEELEVRCYGGKQGFTAIMLIKTAVVACHQGFVLHHFPFDLQSLAVELRVDDPRGADKYIIEVNTVQFHKQTLAQVEWDVMAPLIKPDHTNETSAIVVLLPVQRVAAFYIQNIISVMAVLPVLAFVAFLMEYNNLGDRSNTVLTLILTAVTFKFTAVEGSLPKVPYNTLIDYFMIYSLSSLTSSALTTVIPNFFQDPKWRYYSNMACAGLSILLLIVMFTVWTYQARGILRKHLRTSVPVPSIRGQNWYCFRFTNPAFIADKTGGKAGKASKML